MSHVFVSIRTWLLIGVLALCGGGMAVGVARSAPPSSGTAAPIVSALPLCGNLQINPTASVTNGQVSINLQLVSTQPTTYSMRLNEVSMRVVRQGPVSNVVGTTDRGNTLRTTLTEGWVWYDYENSIAINTPLNIQGSFTLDPGSTSGRGSYRLRYTDGGIGCLAAGVFPLSGQQVAEPVPFNLSIIGPPPEREIVAADAAIFQALVAYPSNLPSPPTIERVESEVFDGDVRISSWNEFLRSYCAFGGDTGCLAPSASWWNQLRTNFNYRLVVTAYASDGGVRSVTTTFRKKGETVSTPTPTPGPGTPTATPTMTPGPGTPTATPEPGQSTPVPGDFPFCPIGQRCLYTPLLRQ